MLCIAQRLVVELPQSHGPCQNIADFKLIVDIVADKAVALGSSDSDLHERLIRPGLIRRGRNGIGPGDQALADLEVEHNVLSRIEEGQFFAVRALEADSLGRLAGGLDPGHHKFDRAGVPLSRDISDRVHVRERGRSGVKRHHARRRDAGGSADVR